MRLRRREPLLDVLLSTGLHLIDSLRDRLPDDVDKIRERVRDTYDTASHRVNRATNAFGGEEDSHIFPTAGALLIGGGVGVAIGLPIAPRGGEETRATSPIRIRS